MRRIVIGLALALLPVSATAAEVRLGARSELTHSGKGHEVHVSAPAVAAASDGTVLLTWAWAYLTYERSARLILDSRRDGARAEPSARIPETDSRRRAHGWASGSAS